jgi:hypothetical protein
MMSMIAGARLPSPVSVWPHPQMPEPPGKQVQRAEAFRRIHCAFSSTASTPNPGSPTEDREATHGMPIAANLAYEVALFGVHRAQ